MRTSLPCWVRTRSAPDGFVLEEEVDGVGVQPDLEIGGFECFAVQAREVGLGAPAGEIGLQLGEGWFGEAEGFPDVGVVAERSAEAFEVEGAAVEGFELGA